MDRELALTKCLSIHTNLKNNQNSKLKYRRKIEIRITRVFCSFRFEGRI